MSPVVRLEGLPFKVTKEELQDFFSECKLADGIESIHLILNRENRASGLGYVELASEEDVKSAANLNEKNIGRYNRYAKVSPCEKKELDWHLNRNKHTEPLYRVRMSGLPYKVSEYDIAKWFEPESNCCDVEIHLNKAGRASGEATAYFMTEEERQEALNKDNEDMSGRYIKLSKDGNDALPRNGYFIRMLGLPFRATEEEIKDFFAPVAECVGARIIYNGDGRPSGDAVAEFETDEMAEKAMKKNREHLGSRFVVLARETAGSNKRGNHENDGGSSDGYSIRMSGLPFRTTTDKIIDWFKPVAKCSRVRIVMNREGRPSGEAIAEFETEEMAKKAMSKNKDYIGERFVILKPQF